MSRILLLSILCIYITLPANAQEFGHSSLPNQLTFAATHWCPYSCAPDNPAGSDQSNNKPGIISEYLTQLLEDNGIQLTIRFLPWSRALAEANNGAVDGLLTVVPEESGILLMPKVPTTRYQDCFFVAPESNWQYKGKESLPNVRLAYIQDYGYNEPLHSYIQNTDNAANLFEVSGAKPSQRLVRLVQAGRADALIEEKRVTRWAQHQQHHHQRQLQHHNQQKEKTVALKQAGCLESKPFYVAITPQHPQAQQLLQLFNTLLSRPEHTTELQQYIDQYLSSVSSD